MVALQGVHDGGSELFHIAGAVVGLDLLDKDGVRFADVKDKVLLLVREQTAYDIVGRDVVAGGDADQQNDALHVRDKMQLTRLGVDVAGQDIVQHNILDKVRLVELFVVVLLDALQADGQHRRKLGGGFVRTLHKGGVIIVLCVGELVVRVAVQGKGLPCGLAHGGHAVTHFPDLPQLRAGNDGAGFIHDTDDAIHSVLHLIHYVLEHTVCHIQQLPFWYIVGRASLLWTDCLL